MKRTSLLSVVLSAVFAIAGCGGSAAPAENPSAPVSTAPPSEAPKDEAQVAVPTAVVAQEKYDVDFVEAKLSPELQRAPRVSIDVPGYDQSIQAKLVPSQRIIYKVDGMNEAPSGSYLQFVLDNKPFRPVTNTTERINLVDLAGPGGLAPGEHIIVGFISRPNNESIKYSNGVAVRRFFVGKPTDSKWNSNKGPLLVFGSPRETVEGDPLIDFIVINAEISKTKYSVRAHISGPGIRPDGIQRVIDDWKPWIILSARDGAEYKIELQLLDPSGEEVVPYGTAERTITIKRP